LLNKMKINSNPTFGYSHLLPLEIGGEIKASGNAAAYLDFYDHVADIVKRGGMQRRSAQPTLEELRIMGVTA